MTPTSSTLFLCIMNALCSLHYECLGFGKLCCCVSVSKFVTCVVLQENVRIEERKLKRKYLNSGDVFILDMGLKIIQVHSVVRRHCMTDYTCSGMVKRAIKTREQQLVLS